MKNRIKNISLIILSVAVILLTIRACDEKETVTIEVPVEIEVPVPVVETDFDTIYLPQPIKVIKETKIDSTIYNKYLALQDSIAKNKLVKDALTIREYNQSFDDSIQTIDVYSEVTGTLNKQQVSYKTKPRNISIDTIIPVDIEIPYKTKFGLGVEVGVPLSGLEELSITPETSVLLKQDIVAKFNAVLDTKKLIYNLSIDSEKRAWAGLVYKF